MRDSIVLVQKQSEEQRKQINELRQFQHKLQLENSTKEQDIEEAYQTLQSKDHHLKEIKETLNRQNLQIEKMREELAILQKSEN